MRGVIPPILTPLRDGKPDLPALRVLLERAHNGGCAAVFVGGTVGYGPLLPDADWDAMVSAALEWGRGRTQVLVGVMETSTPRAIAKLRRLERLGGTIAVVTPTFYVTLRQETEFMRHFSACRAATGMEMIVYNIPSCTGSSIPLPVMLACAREKICRTIKDSSGDRDALAALCRQGKEYGLDVLQGIRPDLAWLSEIGAAGIIPVPANLDPLPYTAGWRAVESGDQAGMRQHQPRIYALWDGLVEGGDWIGGAFWAIGKQGLGDGIPIPPLEPCKPERQARIATLLGMTACA